VSIGRSSLSSEIVNLSSQGPLSRGSGLYLKGIPFRGFPNRRLVSEPSRSYGSFLPYDLAWLRIVHVSSKLFTMPGNLSGDKFLFTEFPRGSAWSVTCHGWYFEVLGIFPQFGGFASM
jgi:hypothetical protein